MRCYLCGICSLVLFSAGLLSGELRAQGISDFNTGVVQPNLSLLRDADQAADRSRTGTQSAAARKRSNDKAELTVKLPKNIEALLVGINDYSISGLENLLNLRGCNNDLRMVRDWLEKSGAENRNITFLSDDPELSNLQPTCDTIRQQLQQKAQVSCDRLYVVISGHGTSIGGKSFFCPQDLVSFNFSGIDKNDEAQLDRKAAENRLLAVSDILSILKTAKAKEVLLILDACRNKLEEGGFMREFASFLKDTDKVFKKKDGSFAVLTGCSSGQVSYEDDFEDDMHGAFTYYFVEGLSGKADYSACYDGNITLTEAYNYAYAKVSDYSQMKSKGPQTPEIFMASSSSNMNMAAVSLPEYMENESDIQFLFRTGMIFSNHKYSAKKTNPIGEEALSCVIDNVPNHTLAYAFRGSVRKKLGNYDGALNDLNQIGEKFQLYTVGGGNNAETISLKQEPNSGSKASGKNVKKDDLLTITESKGDYYLVQEVNNEELREKQGWIPKNRVYWDSKKAGDSTVATMLQGARNFGSDRAAAFGNPSGAPMGGGGVSSPGPVYH